MVWVRISLSLKVLLLLFNNLYTYILNKCIYVWYLIKLRLKPYIKILFYFYKLMFLFSNNITYNTIYFNNSVDNDVIIYNQGYSIFKDFFSFIKINYIVVLFISYYYSLHYYKPRQLIKFKLMQHLNQNNYNFTKTVVNKLQSPYNGLKSILMGFKFWLPAILLCIVFIYYCFIIRSLPFFKTISSYLILLNFAYLLLSGFVFFIKKYQYRLYTSAIQRFWRRTLVIFWLIEISLFSVFIYLVFNASQEPMYVYDTIQIYKTHLYSWRSFLLKVILLTIIIVFLYLLLLAQKWNSFSKNNNIVSVITIILLYLSWLEFYQMFHLMNSYGVTNWVYDYTEHLWNLEIEFKKTRIVNHYVTIGLIAKFWHIIFAVMFWLFFSLRGLESSRYRYPLLVSNLQNIIIIYIMSWIYMYPWLKLLARKFLDIPYFWFFINNRKFLIFMFVNDIKLYKLGVYQIFNKIIFLKIFEKNNFFYFYNASPIVGYSQFKKHCIRDFFLTKI